MSKKIRTYVAIVLDKSKSMKRTKSQTIMGYNEEVSQLKLNAKEQEIYISLVTFNGNVFEHLWNVPADELQEASEEDYVPDGATAMRDAIGYTIQKLKDTTNPDDPEYNTAYLIKVFSDGEDNENKKFNGEEGRIGLRNLINSVQETGQWTISYLGCSEDYLKKVCYETGVIASNSAAWDNTSAASTTGGLRRSTARTGMYFKARSEGTMAVSNFYSDKIGAVADYTQEVGDVKQPDWNNLMATTAGVAQAPSIVTPVKDVKYRQPFITANNAASTVKESSGYFSTGKKVD
jgi:hypothetical protein